MCYSGHCPFEDHTGECLSHKYNIENPCPPHEIGPEFENEYYKKVDLAYKEKMFIDALYVPDKDKNLIGIHSEKNKN